MRKEDDVRVSMSNPRPYLKVAISMLALAASAICKVAYAGSGTLNIYVSPKGADTASGLRADAPVATIGRVQEVVAKSAQGHDEVRVQFAAGVYRGQGVEWQTFPGIWTRFVPEKEGAKVVFDGQGGKHSVFFKASPGIPSRTSAPVSMKLDFTGLTIQNYCEGLSFQSWADSVRRPGGRDVVVMHTTFNNIGSKFDPVRRAQLPRGSCTAALRLQGVGYGKIENNVFRNIINVMQKDTALKRYGPGHLHAIYISNISQKNIISSNRFDNFSGDPVRIRDSSDGNLVVGNVFGAAVEEKGAGTVHAISQWYCNKNVPACLQRNDARMECPSEGLELRGNRIEGHNVKNYEDRSQGEATCIR
ncbi:right-handed parallel beta-helix repeat-containing protein [Achromobacter insolitus]|uniref:hypothetical protein n=1 Tax=Achromobacter insolitus TaxID=217204 RepID=UPI00366E293B